MTIRSPRAAARRNVVAELHKMRDQIKNLRMWWECTSTVYVSPEERPASSNVWQRDRQLDEYPEAQQRYWASTVNELDELIDRAAELRRFAYDEYRKTPKQ
jgi:hypothetical protein